MKRISVTLAFIVIFCLCNAASAVLAAPGTLSNKQDPSYARDLFFEQMRQPESLLNNGVAFCIELHRPGQAPTLCGTRTQFKSGDGIKLHIKSNFDGYAYILMSSGSTGKSAVLFPPPSAPEDNRIQRGREYVIPSGGLLRLDDNPGTENLKLVVSRAEIDVNRALASSKSLSVEEAIATGKIDEDSGFSISEDPGAKPGKFLIEPSINGTRPTPARTSTYVVNSNTQEAVSIKIAINHVGQPSGTTAINPSSSSLAFLPSNTGRQEFSPSASAPVRPTTELPSAGSSSSLSDSNRPLTDKWALCVGIGKFSSPGGELLSPPKDARDLAEFLVREQRFVPSHVRTLTNENATKNNIINALQEWLGPRVKNDDLVVIYMSSHGTPKSQQSGGNFVVPYDYNGKDDSGIRMQDIGNLIKSKIASDRVVVILDTCFAGNAKSKSMDSKDYLDELLQGAGRIVVSACDLDETSLDTFSRYGNSLFTYHLINSMRKEPKLKQAFENTRKAVVADAELLRSRQTPLINYDRWKGNDVILSARPTQPRP